MFLDQTAVVTSLSDFIITHRPQLIALAIRILRCPHLAEDVVQEAAIKVSRIRSCGDRIASPEKFVRSIVRNLAIDHVRRRSFETRIFAVESAGAEIEAPCTNPCGRLEIYEALKSVLSALDDLPPRIKHVFELNRLHGIAQNDIARELNVSTTLVNFMVQRAHDHCLERLREVDDDLAFATRRSRPPRESARYKVTTAGRLDRDQRRAWTKA